MWGRKQTLFNERPNSSIAKRRTINIPWEIQAARGRDIAQTESLAMRLSLQADRLGFAGYFREGLKLERSLFLNQLVLSWTLGRDWESGLGYLQQD